MTGRAAILWAWVAVVLGCLLMPGVAGAVPAQGLPGRAITVCIAPVRAGDTAAAMLRAPAARFDCRRPQSDWPRGDYWARSAPLPAHVGETVPLDVRFTSVWQDRATVTAAYADGNVAGVTMDAHDLSRHLRLGAIVTWRLPDRHVAVTRLLWRIDGAAALRGIVVTPTLATPAETARSDLILCAIYAGFAGLCLALLIYNLMLYAAMRHRFQLIYCVMVLALMGYALSLSGVLAWIVPGIDNNIRLRVNYLTLALAASTALMFGRCFFEERIFEGWLGRTLKLIAPLPVLAAIAYAVLAPRAMEAIDLLFSLSFLPLLGAVVPMLWRAWRRRSNYLWLFAIAWGAPVAMGLLRIASGLHLVRWNIWIDQSTIVSMALEALLSSLAIAYRIRLLAHERDEAREQEIAARLLADVDPLTGLLNRRAFLSRAIGREADQCLQLLDIDHFKRVNETIGHDGGDEVLRVVARALRGAVAADALVARIGGEEFAIVSAAGSAAPPATVLDALRGERMPFDVAVTASIGVCTGPLARETDWKALYRRADQALFAAKAAGRDRARDGGVIATAA